LIQFLDPPPSTATTAVGFASATAGAATAACCYRGGGLYLRLYLFSGLFYKHMRRGVSQNIVHHGPASNFAYLTQNGRSHSCLYWEHGLNGALFGGLERVVSCSHG
jgi:hypothetical protein